MKKIISFVLVLLLVAPLAAFADDITVATAANMQFTLNDLSAEFTKETGIGIKAVIGASGKLTTQIENGAPFDVFLSADMKYPRKLSKDGFTSMSPKVYAKGTLVLWTMRNMDLSKGVLVLSNADIKSIAIADPKVAPYGRAAVNAMKYYKLYDQLQKKLVKGESIAQANQFITSGSADIGFTAKSVVLAPNMAGKGAWADVDPQAYKAISQGVVVLKYGADHHSREAKTFYDFLFSAAAKQIFVKYGYK